MWNSQQEVFLTQNYYPFLYYDPWRCVPTLPPQPILPQVKKIPKCVSLIRNLEEQPPIEATLHQTASSKEQQIIKTAKPRSKPRKRKEREEDYSRKHQKKDRNLPSNIWKMLSQSIYANDRLTVYFKREGLGSQVEVATISQKFKSVVKSNQSYIRPSLIQQFYSGRRLAAEESQIFRAFIRKFLLLELPVMVVQQSKLKKSQKYSYIKLAREMQRKLIDGKYEDLKS